MRYLLTLIFGLIVQTAAAESALRDDLAGLLADSTTPALGYALIENGTVAEVDVIGDAPRNAMFRFGSISKTVTTVMLLRLVERNVLKLDDRLIEIVSDAGVENGEDIRLGDLLEQTSGLPGTSYADYGQRPTNVSPSEVARTREMAARWPPGMFFSYANVNHTLAAAMAEAATGSAFDDLVRDSVFLPLGMRETSFDRSAFESRSIESVDASGQVHPPWDLAVRPSGALLSTIDDMAIFARFIATDQTVVPRMRTPERSLPARAGYAYAYGAGLFPFIENESVYFGHWGRIDGFQAALGTNPQTGSGFVLVANGGDRNVFAAARARLAREVPGTPVVVTQTTAQEALNIDGWWMPFTEDNTQRAWISELLGLVRVVRIGEQLELTPGLTPWRSQTLRKVNANMFRLDGYPIATHVFMADSDGNVFMLGDGQLSLLQISSVQAILRLAIFATSALALLLTPLVCLVILGRRLAGKRKPIDSVWFSLGVASVAAVLLHALHILWGMIGPLAEVEQLARPGARSLGLMALSLIWPAATALAAGFLVFRRGSARRLGLSLATLIVCVYALTISYLNSFGFIPLITWA